MNRSIKQNKRKLRTRSKIKGTKEMPRLSVFKSNKYVSAQLINDIEGKSILGVTEKHLAEKKGQKTEKAKSLGLLLAKKAIEKKIKKVVFDRGGYSYHGRTKAVADGAREGGLEF